ncbi:COPZ1 [Cordylochernes scorpioides]|uniref:Coatomer subunit zeta n=1 Tax=Cordylochernes scorpioides TaxID=51811 RepID=A0ABY6KQ19_9ARAC|nr:COPZ1 [Cordylochernes scorpioides]
MSEVTLVNLPTYLYVVCPVDVATTCVVAEIIMLDGMTCVYRSSVDIIFYVIGSCHENEVTPLTLLYSLVALSVLGDDRAMETLLPSQMGGVEEVGVLLVFPPVTRDRHCNSGCKTPNVCIQLILSTVLGCLHDSVSQILRKNVEKRTLLDSLDIIMLAVDEICDGGIILEADPSAVVQRVALRTDDIPLGEQTVAQVSLIRCSCVTTSAFRSPPPSSYLHMIYLCFFCYFFF